MTLLKEIGVLVWKDLILEWKQKHAFNGLLLYVASTVFVCYLSFKEVVSVPTWNALFWIIMLFAAVNAASRSFQSERKGLLLYYYTIASPQAVILSRMIYNSLLLFVIALIGYLIYSVFIGNLVQDQQSFFLGLLIGSFGLASVLTLVAAIAARSSGNLTLMAILGFPVVIPLLLTLIRFSKNAADGIDLSVNITYAFGVMAINVVAIGLAWILFPYLWKE
ncbi:MAG: heme exporter protein CcmB [Flavobacteriales bacterium]